MICTICEGDFDINLEGGIDGFFGILPVAFCPTCKACVFDFAEQQMRHCGCEIDEKCTTISVCAIQDMIDEATYDLEIRLEAAKSDKDRWQKAVYEARDAMGEPGSYHAVRGILNEATGRE